MKPKAKAKFKTKFKTGQLVWVRAHIGPSGITGDNGVFVNVNAADPEIWVHVKDVFVVNPKRKRGAVAGK